MNLKAIDAGEGYLICAERKDGELVFTIERNVFYSCTPRTKLYDRIRASDLYFLESGGRIQVFGEDAMTIARKIGSHADLHRPVYGPPGPGEAEVLGVMMEAVASQAQTPDDTVYLPAHAPVVDGPFAPDRHQKIISSQLTRLGYTVRTVGRAVAVLFHDIPGTFPGGGGEIEDALSLCFSEELVDVALWTAGKPTVQFTSVRGGRWIDASVAKMREISPLVVERLREHDLDLTKPKPADKVTMMVGIYVEHMIQYVLQMVAAQVKKAGVRPPGAVQIVLAGKIAGVTGFDDKFRAVLKNAELPFPIGGVRLSSDPLRAPVGGALLYALARRSGIAQTHSTPASRAPRVNDLFKGHGTAPAAPTAPTSPPVSASPGAPPPTDLLRKIQLLEDRLADIEDQSVQGSDASYVEELRREAGIASAKETPTSRTPSGDFRPPKIQFEAFFRKMVEAGASDLFLSAGSRPAMRVDGVVKFMSGKTLGVKYCRALVEVLAKRPYEEIFSDRKGIDVAVQLDGIGRFRANFFHQRGNTGSVFRYVKKKVPSFEELNLPAKTLMKLAKQQRGLILVTGVAGSGKSTSIAAMIEYINQTSNRHIVTVEDPIEFVYDEKQSVIDQREVGFDTKNFYSALKSVVRQSPDVIFVGEMRDKETMEAAISAAETGHLVMSTLHTVNAQQTVERIITFFPTYQHDLIRMQLSMVLTGVISQRLLPKKAGSGRAPAVEIMLSTPTIRDLLLEGKTNELYNAISDDTHFGNQTFNESLKGLYTAGVITLEEAMAAADNPDELKLEIRGIQRGTRASDFNHT
jgi:twitching motility protein PilT